ncbi:hypothetical protein HOLleu_34641 [Holothuria leucospilota]|uniref:Uncharacterized protein n=1 Tax=Holothuria leucospilota TaxID=206669 RepID=A0A9Q0YLI3_HOLLE|nr:hypothetical protein HOLleu_34641 [Holothuria leucospilota]
MSIERLMSDLSSIQKRFENFISTGSNVLSYTNDWLAVETLPNLCFAYDGIKDDIGKIKATLSELQDEINLPIPTVSELAMPGEVGFIEREKHLTSTIDLVSMDDESSFPLEYVDRLVFLKSSDCIVMSGNLNIDHSTAVINTTIEGRDLEYLKRFDECFAEKPYCLICQIDENIIATACDKNLGTINVTKSTYNGLTLDDEECLTGICADQTLKQILTHQGNDDIVKVYDLNLDFVKTRELPDSISPSCMIVHDNKLIVGGGEGESNIYVLGEDDEILSVIPPPSLQREESEVWDCLDLCCSRDGTLYALWRKSIDSEAAESGGYIVVYTPRYHPLEIIPTSGEATCLTLMEKDRTKNVMTPSQTVLCMYKVWYS